ncbi:ABC transporter substrate-binding protein [Sphaerisporangium viridialbum]|uniref:ABC transporter substrate-binding protein n=1 Tax=Sphaerisporangium viridialbum TaxID=46189 RepID=UPI003C74EDFA
MQELWYHRRPGPTATGIAADLGWLDDEFTPEGIAVRHLVPDGRRHERTLRTLFRDDGNVPALWARSRGAGTRLIGLTWVEERQAILTRPYVTIRDPEDLRGRRLALPLRRGVPVDVRRATALRGFQGALWAGGLTLNDAYLVDIPVTSLPGRRLSGPGARQRASGSPGPGIRPGTSDSPGPGARPGTPGSPGPGTRQRASGPAGLPRPDTRQWEPELEALARGDVDAVYVKGAAAVEAAGRYGLHVAIDLDGHPDRRVRINDGTVRPITVDQLLLDVRPDVVARFLRVLLDAAEWATAHPDQALSLSEDALPPGPHRLPDLTIDLPDLTIDLSAERLGLLAEQERFLRAHGFLESAVDVASWADHTPLMSAHAHRRTPQEQPV